MRCRRKVVCGSFNDGVLVSLSTMWLNRLCSDDHVGTLSSFVDVLLLSLSVLDNGVGV